MAQSSYDKLWVWKPSALADFLQMQTLPIYKSVKSESLDLAILIWMVSLFALQPKTQKQRYYMWTDAQEKFTFLNIR